MTGPRWLPAAAVTLFAAALAWLNRGETAVLHLGIATFYRAPLIVLLFLAFLAGMLAMLWLSLRHDRRVRDELRRHGLLDRAEPARPATASAWGVAPASREPPSARGGGDQTAEAVDDGGRTAAHLRYEEDPGGREDTRTARYSRYDGEPAD